jgi:hypothetical protein
VDELSDASFELRHGHVDPMMEGYIEWEIATAGIAGVVTASAV